MTWVSLSCIGMRSTQVVGFIRIKFRGLPRNLFIGPAILAGGGGCCVQIDRLSSCFPQFFLAL